MFDNIQRGEYQIGDKVKYFRAKSEANYALYLEMLKKNGDIADWFYEKERYYFITEENGKPKAFGNGYLPDFHIVKNDGSFYLVECKGKEQGMVKLKRMKKFYPHIEIELVDNKSYNDLKRKLGKALNFY